MREKFSQVKSPALSRPKSHLPWQSNPRTGLMLLQKFHEAAGCRNCQLRAASHPFLRTLEEACPASSLGVGHGNSSHISTLRAHEQGRADWPVVALKLEDLLVIRIMPQLDQTGRDPALFKLGIQSKIRDYDLMKLRVYEGSHGGQIASHVLA